VLEGPSSTGTPAASAAGDFFAPGSGEREVDAYDAIARLRVRKTLWGEGDLVKKESLPAFAGWLKDRVVFVEPRSAGEVVRFRSALGMGALVASKRGGTALTGAAAPAYNAFVSGADWIEGRMRAVEPLDLGPGMRQRRKIAFVRRRDGDGCVFCGRHVGPDEESLEHFLATSRGGADVAANWGLAHRICNTEMGDDPVAAKIARALERRCAPASPAPQRE